MCLIAYAPKKSLISLASLENAYENNKDGWGICYQDPVSEELIIDKQLLDFEQFKLAWKMVPEDVHVGVHFRWKTHGDLSRDNVHPYLILDKANGDPVDLALMHNGVISYIHPHGEKRSDTQMYVDLILRPILLKNWELIYDPNFKLLIERDISTGSKFLIMPSKGDPIIYNKKQGHEPKEQPDVWYSNSYSIDSPTWRRGKTTANNNNNAGNGYSYDRYQSNFPSPGNRGSKNEDYKPYIWPTNLTPKEEERKKEILALVKPHEKILDRVMRGDKSLLGYGWVLDDRWNTISCTFSNPLAEKLRKFIRDHTKRVEKEQKEATSSNVIPLPSSAPEGVDKDTEKRLNRANLKLSSRAETLEWVRANPDDATDYLIDAGFSGGKPAVLDWVTKDLDRASEQVYNYAHFNKLIDYNINQPTQGSLNLLDTDEDDYMMGAYGYA